MSDSFSDSDGDMEKHYTHFEKKHVDNLAPVPVYRQLPPVRPPMNITAEQIIESKNDNYLKVLTNFTINEFEELFVRVKPIITIGTHRYAVMSPKTAFLITLCHLKHNEGWRKISANFDINYSYAFQKVKEIINSCYAVLSKHFIKWIGVVHRIQKYN